MWNIIIVGCNGITRKWLDAIRGYEDARIVALVDLVRGRCEAMNADYGLGAEIYEDMNAAFDAHPEANLVLDVTPPSVHHAVVTGALRRGMDVIGEKPLSDSLAAAREMLRAADEAGRRYFVMQNRRYLHGIRTLRAELARTYLGRPYMVACDMLLGSHFMGVNDGRGDFRNTMAHPVLIDMLIHTFDEARYILGDARAVSAYCQEYNPPNSWYTGPAIALCNFEFDNGALLSLRGSWATRCENTTSHGAWRVYCTDGTACWDGDRSVWVTRPQPVPRDAGYHEEEGVREEIPLLTDGREEHLGCVDDMFRALRSGGSMMTECHNNIHSLEMVYACIRSSKTGRKVLLSELE